jgi:hypothetical protein
VPTAEQAAERAEEDEKAAEANFIAATAKADAAREAAREARERTPTYKQVMAELHEKWRREAEEASKRFSKK